MGVLPSTLKSYALWVYFQMYSPEKTTYYTEVSGRWRTQANKNGYFAAQAGCTQTPRLNCCGANGLQNRTEHPFSAPVFSLPSAPRLSMSPGVRAVSMTAKPRER